MDIKKENTPAMFDEIATTYDSLNHILSFGLDKKWRRKFIKNLPEQKYGTIADIASGTGDLLVVITSYSIHYTKLYEGNKNDRIN